MKRLKRISMAITMILMAVSFASAQPGPPPGNNFGPGFGSGFGPKFERGPGFFIQELNLTEEQQTQMQSIRLKMQKEMLPIRNKLGENRAKMRTLTTAENVDMKAVDKLIDESSTLRAKMAKLRAANHQEIRQMLTEEQRIMFDSKGMRAGGKGSFNGPGSGCPRGGGRGPGQGFGPPRPGK